MLLVNRRSAPTRFGIDSFALAARLPTMEPNREMVETGGLISVAPNFPSLDPARRRSSRQDFARCEARRPSGRAADQIDLIINLTTAKALGLEIPPTLLARADEVIE